LAKHFDIEIEKVKFKEPFLTDALLALGATKILFDEVDYEKINSFEIGEHRVEEFKDSHGKLWINDSKATNPDATIAALKSYKERKINLILGGDDKGADLTPLFEELKNLDVKIFAIGKNEQKLKTLSDEYSLTCVVCHKLETAVKKMTHEEKNSINILSPAAASLDQFDSYAQRGELFFKFIKNFS